MSYIHEALQKAQEMRNKRRSPDDAGRPRQARDTDRRRFPFLFPIVFAVLLALAGAVLYGSKPGNPPSPAPEPTESRRVERAGEAVTPKATPSPPAPVGTGPSPSAMKEALYEKALQAQRSGDPAEAEALYRRLLEIDPRSGDGLNNLGVLLLARGDAGEAEKVFRRAVEADGTKADPYYNLACLCSLQGRLGEGLQYLEKAASLKKDVKSWAKDDKDLENLRCDDGFERILGR